KYQAIFEQAYQYHTKNLKKGYSFTEIDQNGPQTVYIFGKYGDLTQEDIDYLIDFVRPIDEREIVIELLSKDQNKQATMRYSKNKEFISCEKPYYFASSVPNICLKEKS